MQRGVGYLDKKDKQNTPLDNTLFEWRLDEVEKRTKALGDNVDRISERTGKLERRTDELKVYVTNILNTVQEISGDFKKLDELSTKRHVTQQEKWTGFFQKITYLVIGAIVTYLFSQFR